MAWPIARSAGVPTRASFPLMMFVNSDNMDIPLLLFVL
jgi:hypothetical protein